MDRDHSQDRSDAPRSPEPRLATLEDDGWTLLDAEQRMLRREGLYWLPDRWVREHLEDHVPEGGFAKLLFRLADPSRPSEPVVERMWVTLNAREGELYHGHLANAPHTPGAAREGMSVWFRAEHVIDYAGPHGEGRASDAAEAIHCERHGASHACYVCEHMTFDSERRGFHTADPDSPRPDAWCDDCHEEFLRAGDWEAPGAREPRIRLVCGGCYDLLKARHGGSAPPPRAAS